jgi:KaiC/GvpD/RAD55 family RecA-like ATPase
MREKLPVVLLTLFLLAATVNGVVENLPPSSALPTVNNITLFARLDESVPAYGGMILSPSPNWSGQQMSDAYGENVFTLYPILGQQLKILGTVLFRVWLRSDSPTFGKVTFSLSELSVNGNLKEVTRTEGYVGVNTRSSDFNFAIASVNVTIEPSSALQFRFTYTSTDPRVKVYLLWNDPQTPTQVVIPCLDHISLDLGILDKSGRPVSAYNANQTGGRAGVWVKLGTVDPFGLRDLKAILISVSDSMGNRIVQSQPMSLNSSGASFYSGVYIFNASFGIGMYSVVISVMDMSSNAYYLSKTFSVSYFYAFQFIIVDEEDHPLSGANYTISNDSNIYAMGSTNASGWTVQQLPSSNIAGEYDVSALWKNAQLTILSGLNLSRPMTLHLKASVFKVTARCILYGVPLSGAAVYLLSNSSVIADTVTGLDGSATFNQIPAGDYVVRVRYMAYQYETEISVEKSSEILVTLEVPYLGRIPYIAMSAAVFAIILVFIRRRQKVHPATISILDNLVEGGLPQSATIMILGPSASGKTVLLENLMYTSLNNERPCVFIATMQFPSEIRKEMKALGFDTSEYEKKEKLAFIDCYSAAAGKTSVEKYSVSSITDLTRLGTELSTCLESLGKETEVFLDSVAPWVAALKPEFIISFVHGTGAKVKAGDGRFYFTVGTSVEKEFLTKIEEASDGVIELKILESEKEPRRKLGIRKIRGRKHSTRWLNFLIVEGKGIVFQIRGKSMESRRKNR